MTPPATRFRVLCGLGVAMLTLAAACHRKPPSQDPDPYVPTATVKELMLSVIDPTADVGWGAVTAVMQDDLVELAPVSEEEWEHVRHAAVTLAEASNLLMVPGRRVAPPGDTSVVPGVELEPEEMDALIAENRDVWHARAAALREAVEEVLAAIDARDADGVFMLGERIELACEGCHGTFWYPGEVIPAFPADATDATQP